MTGKEKKEYSILGILLIAILGLLYFVFLRGPSSPQPATTDQAAASSTPAAKFLPNGTSFNIKLLQDPRFTNLTAPTYPTVDPSEVGLPNPFGK